ncbi:hypothetical protein PR202_ga02807 [Eleusine coracana subsp. coracana]|uniref:Uncharacterized protein n=1 Tax=Eleusine coracana subsp. coracana TaxID=191504 RepID=A0AAV5BNA2_ELECO|nr:hypothetical protein PR202_ga02807 [Eleusine coracana subsp. coracana]
MNCAQGRCGRGGQAVHRPGEARGHGHIFDDFNANLRRLDADAHAVYARFRRVFGSANEDLLRGFALVFLPTKFDLVRCAEAEQADRRPELKRQRAGADPDVGAAERSTAKKPGLDDGHTPARYTKASCNAGAGVIWSSRRLNIAKKPRAHDDPEATCKPSPSSRPKNPRTNNGENGHAALNGATGRGAAAAQDDQNGEVLRLRKAWEFETGYSKLVATTACVEKELRRDGARGDLMEKLFPSRECREFLAKMYGDAWGTVRTMLEHDEYIGSALKVILDSLTAMEAARRWGNPARAKPRLNDIVQDTAREERARRGA